MTEHLLLAGASLAHGACDSAYTQYLAEWRESVVVRAEGGDVAASLCLQAAFIDLVLAGDVKHDWIGIMDQYLLGHGKPLAYSAQFGANLCGFGEQWLQSTIHAIHTRWWMETICTPDRVDHDRFAQLVKAKLQTDGLIYDLDVSETILRHRMKSELTLSAAMSVEILVAAGSLPVRTALELATNLVDPKKCPPLGYMGMEFFRLRALQLLGHEAIFPVGIDTHIAACAKGLAVGWCDFSIDAKVDPYMGTAKRTGRDRAIHSPLTARHVVALADRIVSVNDRQATNQRFQSYAAHLRDFPNDIPAFQMRDVPIPFGVGQTPIEVICASSIIAAPKGS